MGIEQMSMGQLGNNRRPDQPLRSPEYRIPGDLQIASTFAQITDVNPGTTEEKRVEMTMRKLGIPDSLREKVRNATRKNSRISFGSKWGGIRAPKEKDDESE
jgi:hypothetical protein